jgi:hypothetical protein
MSNRAPGLTFGPRCSPVTTTRGTRGQTLARSDVWTPLPVDICGTVASRLAAAASCGAQIVTCFARPDSCDGRPLFSRRSDSIGQSRARAGCGARRRCACLGSLESAHPVPRRQESAGISTADGLPRPISALRDSTAGSVMGGLLAFTALRSPGRAFEARGRCPSWGGSPARAVKPGRRSVYHIGGAGLPPSSVTAAVTEETAEGQ